MIRSRHWTLGVKKLEIVTWKWLERGHLKSFWRGSENTTPKHAFCIWSFWAESNWETAETWRALWPPLPFFYLGGHKFPTRKVPFLCQEEKNILGPWHKKSMPRRVCMNLSKIGLSSTSFPYVFPSHFLTIYYSWPKRLFPSFCHVFTMCHYLLKWQRSPQVSLFRCYIFFLWIFHATQKY